MICKVATTRLSTTHQALPGCDRPIQAISRTCLLRVERALGCVIDANDSDKKHLKNGKSQVSRLAQRVKTRNPQMLVFNVLSDTK